MNKKQNGFFRSDILTIESIAKEKSRQMCKWHPQGSSRSRTNGTPSGEIHGFRFIYNRKYYTRKNKNRTEKLNPQGSSEGVPSVRRVMKFIRSDLFQIEKYCEGKKPSDVQTAPAGKFPKPQPMAVFAPSGEIHGFQTIFNRKVLRRKMDAQWGK